MQDELTLLEADLKLLIELSEGFPLVEERNALDCSVAYRLREEVVSHVLEVVELDDLVVQLLEEDRQDLWSLKKMV